MTLYEKLRELGPETRISVGSYTGFFYFGTAGDLFSYHESVDADNLSEYTRKRDIYIKQFKRSKVGGSYRKKVGGTLARLEEKISRYEPICKRQIVKCYHKISGELALIVTGEEAGKFFEGE